MWMGIPVGYTPACCDRNAATVALSPSAVVSVKLAGGGVLPLVVQPSIEVTVPVAVGGPVMMYSYVPLQHSEAEKLVQVLL